MCRYNIICYVFVNVIVNLHVYVLFLDTNILVHQTCSCVSPLQCVCPGGNGVTYVLGDMDLFCVQGKTLSGKYLKWAKEKFTEPAGTQGLKPTEVCINILIMHVHPMYVYALCSCISWDCKGRSVLVTKRMFGLVT